MAGASRPQLAASAIGGVALGTAAGWWAGSYTACVDAAVTCQPSIDAISALGTWVGGLGTVAAVIFAAASLRRDEIMLARAQEGAQNKLREHAESVVASIDFTDFDELRVQQVRIRVTNPPGSFAVNNVSVDIPDLDLLVAMPRVGPGESASVLRDIRPPVELIRIVASGSRSEAVKVLHERTRIQFDMGNQHWQR